MLRGVYGEVDALSFLGRRGGFKSTAVGAWRGRHLATHALVFRSLVETKEGRLAQAE